MDANFPLIHTYMRKWLSDMRCFSINHTILTVSNILEIFSNFFHWIVSNNTTYRRVPEDVRSDIQWLKRKWRKGDWNLSDPLRGIIVTHNGRIGRILDKNWKFYRPCWKRFGNNGLISGETWPYQLAILRDGGHGSPEAGISGILGQGATSIILSKPENRDEYADWDQGYKLGYVSTSGFGESPTRCTQLLLDTFEWYTSSRKVKIEGDRGHQQKEQQGDKTKKGPGDGKEEGQGDGKEEGQGDEKEEEQKDEKAKEQHDRPVRVFRSWRLPPKNEWRPKNGFRYDGLYDVVEKELLDAERALYRFTMERRPNQWKIRADQPDDQTLKLWYQVAAVQKAGGDKGDLP